MPHSPEMGEVLLVGAGPGSADLLTVRALRAIESAGAVLYDALVCDEVVALAPRGCLKLRTGKRANETSMRQDTINRLMLKLARRGLKVVRLKGGDPSVFGRSGEERGFLESRGVPVSIIPGVTAASAAAAQFSFPLTHRAEARCLTLATARVVGGVLQTEGWNVLASADTTLAIYMGRDAAGAVAERLIEEGRSPQTPCLVVENAGRPEALAKASELGRLSAVVADLELSGPTVLIIGAVTLQARIGRDVAEAPRRHSASRLH